MEFIITQLNDNRDDLSAMPKVLSVLICAFNQGDGVGGGGKYRLLCAKEKTSSLLGQLSIKIDCPERLCILHP